MPLEMRNADRMLAVDRLRSNDRVWFENVAANSGTISLGVPEFGEYQVILVKINRDDELKRKKPNIMDFVGYGKRFHPEYRSTAEVMNELREGEAE